MATTMNGLTLVDDMDSSIQYSAGWQVQTGGQEVDGTKHGATETGMTASFKVTGTLVKVVGSLGSIDVYGIPTTTYTIDGQVVGSYTAPVLQPGDFRLNATFFLSDTLDPAQHDLVITMVNGTSPNTFWLDYILFAPAQLPTSSSSSSSATSLSSASASSATPAHSGSSSSSTNASAIVGGVVGGLAFAAIGISIISWFVRRNRRRSRVDAPEGRDVIEEIEPFTSPSIVPELTPEPASVFRSGSPSSVASTKPIHTLYPPQMMNLTDMLQLNQSTSAPGVSSVVDAHSDVVQQHIDSGIRLRPGEALPPPFTQT